MNQVSETKFSEKTVLTVAAVSKSYGKNKALDNINFQINSGEFVGLLGPNGAGKTTLFQLLTGLFVADQGEILIQGHDIRYLAVKALAGIGVVFQQSTLDLDLSVGANLKFHANLHGINKKEADNRILQELERLDLLTRIDDPVRSLSGGNKRKVELARALLHRPQILLMDEASIGLDPASRTSLVNYVCALCEQRNVAVLWATHLVDEIESATKVMVLNKGHILADTTPNGLIDMTQANTINDAFLELTSMKAKDRAITS